MSKRKDKISGVDPVFTYLINFQNIFFNSLKSGLSFSLQHVSINSMNSFLMFSSGWMQGLKG